MAEPTRGQDAIEGGIFATAVGRDDEGHLSSARKNGSVVAGKRIPHHRGCTCQELAYPFYIPRRSQVVVNEGRPIGRMDANWAANRRELFGAPEWVAFRPSVPARCPPSISALLL